jgi:16S rRNA C967 or C1407 C5-methylase (RsmB/RsmF family)/NOL1/NOP2/fmu family ribosome biogenesis protein
VSGGKAKTARRRSLAMAGSAAAGELPALFVSRERQVLGDDAGAFLASLDGAPVRALRVNEHKASLGQVAARLGLAVDPVPWCQTATYLPPQALPGDSAEHRAGLFYLQEPSSMAVVEALSVEPHHLVLDVAAAPGGKSTHAASKLGPDGMLLANEMVGTRLGPLLANLDAWGYPNVAIASAAPPRLAEALPASFDRVIVDAPCSGEALFRRQPALRAEWSEAQVAGAARRQARLLASSARTVAPGGLLAYSTCTFALAENERVLEAFLDQHADWDLHDLGNLPCGVPSAIDQAGTGYAVRFYPHLCRCEGQFVAVLRAPGREQDRERGRGHGRGLTGVRRPARPRQERDVPYSAWTEFAAQVLRADFDPGRLDFRGATCYLRPAAMPVPANVALRPGLPLGRLVGASLRPAHALAMALRPADVTAYEELGGEDLRAFREGREIARPGQPGWVLVTTGQWPVGWARRKAGFLLPKLPGHVRARH